MDVTAPPRTATFQPLRRTTTTRRSPLQATIQARWGLIATIKPQRQNQHLCISINMIDEHLCRKSETWMDTRAREKEAGRLNARREKKR